MAGAEENWGWKGDGSVNFDNHCCVVTLLNCSHVTKAIWQCTLAWGFHINKGHHHYLKPKWQAATAKDTRKERRIMELLEHAFLGAVWWVSQLSLRGQEEQWEKPYLRWSAATCLSVWWNLFLITPPNDTKWRCFISRKKPPSIPENLNGLHLYKIFI